VCATVTGSPGGSNTQLQWNNSSAFGGISQWTTNGTTTLTGSSTSKISDDLLQTALMGPGINNTCFVDGIIYTTVAQCAAYFVANSLSGGIIVSNTPEHWTSNPFYPSGTQLSFTLLLGNGLSGGCDSSGSHNTCWYSDVPIIVPAGGDIIGQGAKVISVNDNSNGTAITFSSTFPTAIGPPANSTLTCSGTGGSIPFGTVVYVETE
jgi:hypothetical protein